MRCLLWKMLTVFTSYFGEGPQFAVVEEYTCNICIESSDFDSIADFSAVKNVFSGLKASTARKKYAVDV